MNITLCGIRLAGLLLPGILMLAQSPAEGAAVKATFFACRDQAVFKKAFQLPAAKEAKNAKNDSEAYFRAKIATGDCLQLARGQEISVDQRAGDLWCVRLSGGLECYWTADKAIDLNPSTQQSSSGELPRRGRNH